MQEINALKLKRDRYYFLSPFGLGDTMILSGFKKTWEKKHGGKIHFLIKASHELIMKMYGIHDYTVISLKNVDCDALTLPTDKGPEKGKIYVAHPYYHSAFKDMHFALLNGELDFRTYYTTFLDIPQDSPLLEPIQMPTVSKELKTKLKAITSFPLKQIALLLPEASSLAPLSVSFWKRTAEMLTKQNFVVIQNVLNPSFLIPDVPNIDLTIEELIALGFHCGQVHALRSGMCDLLASKCKDLFVYYPQKKALTTYALKFLFPTCSATEKVIRERSESRVNIRIAGIIPLLRIRTRKSKTTFYFFNFVPLFGFKRKLNNTRFYLLGIPLLKTEKETPSKMHLKMFGFPLVSIKKK